MFTVDSGVFPPFPSGSTHLIGLLNHARELQIVPRWAVRVQSKQAVKGRMYGDKGKGQCGRKKLMSYLKFL